MSRRAIARLPIVLLLAFAACAPEPAPVGAGRRVISLSPSISGIVVALGAADELVGVDRYSRDVAGIGRVPSVGGLFTPDLERTLELQPTLVLGVRSAQQNAFFAQLRARGVTVHEVQPHTLAEVLASYAEIGELLGRDAAPLIARVHAELDAVRASVAGLPRLRVALVVEREPLYVVGSGNFVDALIEAAGGENVFGDIDAPYPQVSLELLAERAPDVLIDSTAADPAQAAAVRAHWARFSWMRRVELIEQGVATLPGPELARGARLIRDLLHGKPGQRPGAS